MASPVRRCRALAAAAALAVTLSGCTADAPSSDTPSASGTASPATRPVDCAGSIESGPLPTWARDGFVDEGASFKHVEGLRGAIVGVVFGYPLTAPARASRQNKILWIAQDDAVGRLTIDARLDGAGPVVRREVGFGGGQSIVDLPAPGCWRMTLHWGRDVTDVVDLSYVRRG